MDNFYLAFEEKYRGSRELIKRRLSIYLPFVIPLLDHHPNAAALDLGCGRGEWLELISIAGFNARGVDLDSGMLSVCRKLGFTVDEVEMLDALRSAPSSSVAIVSAFHVIEHIEFDRVRELIAEAKRVLLPGGILILETPNPENILVGGCNFYLDPTHRNPIPPQLLSFAVEYADFERTKVLRLQEPEWLRNDRSPVTLMNVLEGVSPDYAVIGQKGASMDVMLSNASAFERQFGLDLRTLSARYAVQVEDRALRAEEQIENLLHSASWRITKPLRLAADMLSDTKEKLRKRSVLGIDRLRLMCLHFLVQAMRCVLNYPRLSYHINQRLMRWPTFHRKLVGLAKRNRITTRPQGAWGDNKRRGYSIYPGVPFLTPRAIDVQADLKLALDYKRKERSQCE